MTNYMEKSGIILAQAAMMSSRYKKGINEFVVSLQVTLLRSVHLSKSFEWAVSEEASPLRVKEHALLVLDIELHNELNSSHSSENLVKTCAVLL